MRHARQSERSFRAFSAWLRAQVDRDDPVGELGRGFARDHCATDLVTVGDLDAHLIAAHAADDAILAARERAWEEFVASGEPPARPPRRRR